MIPQLPCGNRLTCPKRICDGQLANDLRFSYAESWTPRNQIRIYSTQPKNFSSCQSIPLYALSTKYYQICDRIWRLRTV